MIPPRKRAYRNEERNIRIISAIHAPERGWSAMAQLEGEFPDSRLTAAHRRFVRWMLAVASRCLSDEGMMHLSNGAEYVARRKRAAKEEVGRQ